jgi:hypothetical protein
MALIESELKATKSVVDHRIYISKLRASFAALSLRSEPSAQNRFAAKAHELHQRHCRTKLIGAFEEADSLNQEPVPLFRQLA